VPVYGIPYGCLVPRGVKNLLVAGRAISATRTAMSSSRVMAQCMAEGEAAGLAASICAKEGCSPEQIDVARLRAALADRGVKLSR
ncbi:MAG: FAD-dependent oxidoreductase, partial [Clostridia bacterium]|nr:FAD-dependent oxidoreductase [Clostridia bacterium]